MRLHYKANDIIKSEVLRSQHADNYRKSKQWPDRGRQQQLPDGTTVTLLAHEGDELFELDDTQEVMLLAAIAEAERGEVIDAPEVLQKLRS